ncbi:hypothetical protein AB0K09_22610 [Streptomyces sp. NPDC049577]|uniref:hypothetical protein n=1 Tax=Streptomyces sp. NPDC049577 TaxID=3155153 RepID=UPI003442558B
MAKKCAEKTAKNTAKKSKAASWVFAGVMAVMAVSVVVDLVRGAGLDWSVAAMVMVLGPYAVAEVLGAHGRERAAARAGAVSNRLVLPSAVVLWAGLIIGWSRGEGTPWLVFAAAVLITLLEVARGLAVLRERRTAA